jgi:hypothetical protein
MVKVTVSKLDTPYKAGDWHDPAFKWTVRGPGTERQEEKCDVVCQASAQLCISNRGRKQVRQSRIRVDLPSPIVMIRLHQRKQL